MEVLRRKIKQEGSQGTKQRETVSLNSLVRIATLAMAFEQRLTGDERLDMRISIRRAFWEGKQVQKP